MTKTFILAPAPRRGCQVFAMPQGRPPARALGAATVASYQSLELGPRQGLSPPSTTWPTCSSPACSTSSSSSSSAPTAASRSTSRRTSSARSATGSRSSATSRSRSREDSQRILFGRRPGGHQGVPEHAQQADRPGRRPPQEARVPGHDDLRLRPPRAAQRPAAGQRRRSRARSAWPIAKDNAFIATEPTLLEQVLRGGGAAPGRQPRATRPSPRRSRARSAASPTSGPRSRPGISYDMIKSGQFEKALQGAAVAGGPDVAQDRQAHRQGQAARLLRLRQVPLPGRRLRHHGRGRRH